MFQGGHFEIKDGVGVHFLSGTVAFLNPENTFLETNIVILSDMEVKLSVDYVLDGGHFGTQNGASL